MTNSIYPTWCLDVKPLGHVRVNLAHARDPGPARGEHGLAAGVVVAVAAGGDCSVVAVVVGIGCRRERRGRAGIRAPV